MESKKITFITTIYNEGKTIRNFLKSLTEQSKLPFEIIIVDGGSKDNTVPKIKYFKSKILNKKVNLKVLIKPGNRSVGRNEAIINATGDIIVCSDAGNVLDKDWVKNIVEPFKDTSVEVVAGYYRGIAKNVFQKCLIPYALVMPDKVDPGNFLPATRSIAFTKTIWEHVGGFDERFSHNEDYVFAKKLKKTGVKIVFRRDAIVYWMPCNTLKEAYVMMWRFAYGDAEAGIWRPKVIFLLLRYIIGIALLISFFFTKSFFILYFLFFTLFLYNVWAVSKNYKYVKKFEAVFILPVFQFTADYAVLNGTILGLIKRQR